MRYAAFLRNDWRLLAFGFALTCFSGFGQTFFIGVFGGDLRETFSISHGEYGQFYMVATLASSATLLQVGRLLDHVDLRLFTALVCLGVSGACLLMSVAGTTLVLVLSLYALRLSGQGLMGHTAFTTMARYFDSERARAMSIAALGFSAGWALFPRTGDWLLERFPWQVAWRWVALAALLTVPLALWLLRGHGHRHERWRRRIDQDEAPPGTAPVARDRQWTRAEVLRDPRFYLLAPGLVAGPLLITGFVFHGVHLADAKGWGRAWLASCNAGLGIAAAVTSLLLGPLTDRFGARRLVRILLVPLSLSMLALALVRHPGGALGYMVMAGVNFGAATPVIGSLWADLYGVLHLGAIRALASAVMVLSTALAPFLMGVLFDAGLSIEQVAALAVAYTVLAAVLIEVAMRRPG